MSKEADKNKKKDGSLTNLLGWLWAFCFMTPIMLFMLIYRQSGTMPEKLGDWGVIGDFVGGISNPFISALTFLALVLTIIQNQKVLRLNEEELRETRKEIELTREANEQQVKEFKVQNDLTQRKSQVDFLTQALLQLSSRMRNEWLKTSTVAVSPYQFFSNHSVLLREQLDSGQNEVKEQLRSIIVFLPVAVSYAKLLITFENLDSNNPMIRSLVSLNADILALLLINGYFEVDLNDLEKALLDSLLQRYYPAGFICSVSV